MKIKRKVQKTLPQLIEWAIDNEIKHRVFVSNPNFDGVTYKLGFDIGGDLYFEEALTPTLLFTVEVEEEITGRYRTRFDRTLCRCNGLFVLYNSQNDYISLEQYDSAIMDVAMVDWYIQFTVLMKKLNIFSGKIDAPVYKIQKGDRLAQLVIVPIWTPELETVKEFSNETARGEKGFGSTGY